MPQGGAAGRHQRCRSSLPVLEPARSSVGSSLGGAGRACMASRSPGSTQESGSGSGIGSGVRVRLRVRLRSPGQAQGSAQASGSGFGSGGSGSGLGLERRVGGTAGWGGTARRALRGAPHAQAAPNPNPKPNPHAHPHPHPQPHPRPHLHPHPHPHLARRATCAGCPAQGGGRRRHAGGREPSAAPGRPTRPPTPSTTGGSARGRPTTGTAAPAPPWARRPWGRGAAPRCLDGWDGHRA